MERLCTVNCGSQHSKTAFYSAIAASVLCKLHWKELKIRQRFLHWGEKMIGRMKRRPFLPLAQHRGTERSLLSLLSLCVWVCFRIYVKLAGCHLITDWTSQIIPTLDSICGWAPLIRTLSDLLEHTNVPAWDKQRWLIFSESVELDEAGITNVSDTHSQWAVVCSVSVWPTSVTLKVFAFKLMPEQPAAPPQMCVAYTRARTHTTARVHSMPAGNARGGRHSSHLCLIYVLNHNYGVEAASPHRNKWCNPTNLLVKFNEGEAERGDICYCAIPPHSSWNLNMLV